MRNPLFMSSVRGAKILAVAACGRRNTDGDELDEGTDWGGDSGVGDEDAEDARILLVAEVGLTESVGDSDGNEGGTPGEMSKLDPGRMYWLTLMSRSGEMAGGCTTSWGIGVTGGWGTDLKSVAVTDWGRGRAGRARAGGRAGAAAGAGTGAAVGVQSVGLETKASGLGAGDASTATGALSWLLEKISSRSSMPLQKTKETYR